jgi:hypothetical protein
MPRYIILILLISFFIVFVTIKLQPAPLSTLPSNSIVAPIDNQNNITKTLFKESSLMWRIQNKHQQTSKQLTSLTETIGSGICTLDINQDGWMDLFFIGGSGHTRYYGKKSWWLKNSGNRLLLNMKGKYFSDITDSSGLSETIWGMGCSVADFNNDGLTDLLITTVGENHLYANQANNTFKNVTEHSGLSGNNWSMSAALGDYNKDGLLDIYLSNYVDYTKGARTFERTQGFRLTTDIAFDATLYDPQPNKLYLNKGDFVFENVTNQMEVANPLGRSVGAKWYDINQDSWLDLIVINAQKSANQVFINHKGKKFTRGEALFAPLEVSSSHDFIINDFNNNLQDEFFISRSMGLPPIYIKNSNATEDDKKQTFKDDAWNNGLAQAKLLSNNSWATIAADFNNDSYLDIFIANGISAPDIDAPFMSQGQQNNIFLNNKSNGFTFQPAAFDNHFPNSSRGAITVDLNNDGNLEIVVNNNNSDLQIFENQSKNNNNWLGIDLFTENKGEKIYGSTVELITKKLTLKRKIKPKQSFLSQSDHRIHFGLEKSDIIDKLVVYWTDGKISSFNNVPANQYITINKQTNEIISSNTNFSNRPLNNIKYTKFNEQSLQALVSLLLQYPPEEISNKTIDIWHNSSPKVQAFILRKFNKNWHSSFLPIVKEALTSQHSQLRLHAIQLLKISEIESSINWLIPLLNDIEPIIQCKIANTFEFYFDEEEAVTHRKLLALSPLIKKLESANDEVKICIVNALARAENKRAVFPLLQLASTSENPMVQAASIRALGLIRDKVAIKLLLEVTRNAQAEAQVVASALIALKRLNYEHLSQLVNLAIIPEAPSKTEKVSTIKKNHQVLTYLFSHPDGTIFPHNQLESLFNSLIRQKESANTQDDSVIVEKLNTIAAGKLQQHYSHIQPFIHYPNPNVELQAFKSLASLNNLKAKTLFENSLLKLPFTDLIPTLKQLNKPQLTLSAHFIKEIIKKAHREKYPIGKLSKLLPILSKQSASKFFHTLMKNKLTDSELLALFNECTHTSIPNLIKIDVNTANFSNKTLLAYATCIFSEKEYSLVNINHKNSLKKQQLLLTLLTNKSLNDNEKNALLIKAAQDDALIAKVTLLKRINTLSNQYYPKALNALSKHRLTVNIEDSLWKMLKNDQQKNEIRLEAANHLAPLAPSKVLTYINKNFINHE